jgi:pyruvate formate lyase activating enzyme
LDTSAACYDPKQSEKFKTLMKSTDLVLLDIKHIDSIKHQKLTGSPNHQVISFARYLDELKVKVMIRHVLVPTLTDDEADLRKLRSFLDTLTNVIGIDVLPYHKKGITKWKALGFLYELEEIPEPSEDLIEKAELILKDKYVFLT